MTATIRPARPGHESDILRLIQALADYEREPDAVETTTEQLRVHLFVDVPRVFAHVAEHDGRIVGIAVWFLSYSTWTGRHGIYLEDLFVDPAVRGSGVARDLVRALAAEAKEHQPQPPAAGSVTQANEGDDTSADCRNQEQAGGDAVHVARPRVASEDAPGGDGLKEDGPRQHGDECDPPPGGGGCQRCFVGSHPLDDQPEK